MHASTEFLITMAAIAVAWLSLRADIRALTTELRKLESDPEQRARDLEFDRAILAVSRAVAEPVGPREILEAHNGRT